jgi:KUP system potassium uptake protein
MGITAILLYVVARERWHWPRSAALAVTGLFLSIDLAFFGANLIKVFEGGWLPLVIAGVIFTLMTTWHGGRRIVARRLAARTIPLDDFMAAVKAKPPSRVPGTAVFMTAQPSGTPPALAHNLRYNKVLHEHVIILMVTTASTPHVADDDRVDVESHGDGVYNLRVKCGFMEDPEVPQALERAARAKQLPVDFGDVTYFLGRETLIVTKQPGMALWREKLFALMARNAGRATAFFRLPPERVVELGVEVEL